MAQEYGDGIAWIRASMIGRGSSGRVYLATLRNPTSRNTSLPPVMAVKSAEVSSSASIQKEREAYSNLGGSPYIIKCYGEEITTGSNGAMAFNLLLEYGSGGTLSDRMKQSGGNGLAELEARLHTRSILRGLRHIHGLGYVHCDMKPDNIMLVPNGGAGGLGAKIGDLGLAKRVKQSRKRKLGACWEGTPMYLSPEAVVEHVQEAPSDVWAVGCIVLEMLTGKSPLGGKKEMRAVEILREIGAGHGRIEIPTELSKEARAFLKGCFVKNPNFRLTCEMLLNHSFLEGLEEDGGDVVDENEIESFGLVSGSDDDDEFSSDSWSDGSETDSFSEGDSTNANDELVSKAEEEAPQLVGIGGFTDDFLRSNQTSKSSSTARLHYPVGLNIPAGILQKIR